MFKGGQLGSISTQFSKRNGEKTDKRKPKNKGHG